MRAVAALSVVGYHLRLPGFAGGGLGVDIFFTQSGFLISSIILTELERTGRLSYAKFYIRRGLRLLPAYLAVVVLALVAYFVVVAVGGTLRGALFSFFYVANWAAAFDLGLGTLAHTWSLSVEEQFYFIWPVLLVLLFRRARGGRGLLTSVGVAWAAMWVVTEDGGFAGTAAAFTVDGDREVSFWIARHAWGRGVATAALRLLVSHEPVRPLYARAASHNAGSIAVLRKVGFTEVSRNVDFAPGLGREVEEIVFTLPPSLDGV